MVGVGIMIVEGEVEMDGLKIWFGVELMRFFNILGSIGGICVNKEEGVI